MEILIFVLIILCGVCFFVGKRFASKPIENKNEEIKQERQKIIDELQQKETNLELKIKDLNSDIQLKENKLQTIKNENDLIKQQYEEKLKIIQNTEKLAEETYKNKNENLETQYQKKKQLLEEQIQEIKDSLVQTQFELDSLKTTKAATIKAARQEQQIQENKDFYTLNVPKEEQRDIAILEDTKLRISKPRAISMVIWTAYYQQIAKVKFPKILGKTNVCGVYKITNTETEECYIGQSKDVRKRWYEHVKAGIGIDTPAGNKLYAAIQKYGIEKFTFELLEECAPQDLDKKEKYFIELYQSNSLGYNGNKGNN